MWTKGDIIPQISYRIKRINFIHHKPQAKTNGINELKTCSFVKLNQSLLKYHQWAKTTNPITVIKCVRLQIKI